MIFAYSKYKATVKSSYLFVVKQIYQCYNLTYIQFLMFQNKITVIHLLFISIFYFNNRAMMTTDHTPLLRKGHNSL
jgi:hypothetical protein